MAVMVCSVFPWHLFGPVCQSRFVLEGELCSGLPWFGRQGTVRKGPISCGLVSQSWRVLFRSVSTVLARQSWKGVVRVSWKGRHGSLGATWIG